MTPHLNCLNKTVQMRGHNISSNEKLEKLSLNDHQILPLIKSSALLRGVSEKKIQAEWQTVQLLIKLLRVLLVLAFKIALTEFQIRMGNNVN